MFCVLGHWWLEEKFAGFVGFVKDVGFERESGLGSGDTSIEGRLVMESLGEGLNDIDDCKDIAGFVVFM